MLLAWSQSATSPADLTFAKDILGKVFGDFTLEGINPGSENRDSQPETPQELLYAPPLFIYFDILQQLLLT